MTLAVAVLPWHRSGDVRRRGFELARTVDRAGLVTSGWRQALLVGVFLLPMLAALTCLGAALGHRRATGTAATAFAVVALAAAAVVLDVGGAEPGPVVAAAVAAAALACGLYLLLKGRR